jgi:hypothetical protein
LAIDAVTTIINWAIFLDLLYSIVFVVPSLVIVLANRSPASRNIFMNFAMWVHDHQKGPLIAVAEIIDSFGRIFGGKSK